ncbi:unnamed protein product [Brassica oleracea]
MEITERRHDEIMDNVKSQYVSDERHSRARAQSWNQTSYEDIIKKIVEFNTVEGFWACYCHLARTYFQYVDFYLLSLCLFVCGSSISLILLKLLKFISIRMVPTAMVESGSYVSPKVYLLGSGKICAEDIISVWNRNAFHHQVRLLFTRSFAIKRHLKLPHAYVMEYKPHDASLRDSSSYRNTWLRG